MAANTSSTPPLKIAVRRCSYLDSYSGEEYKGVASNYLCDLKPGDTLSITGPFGLVFEVPESEAELMQRLVRERMEGVLELRVPLVVDLGMGKNWREAH